MHIKLNPIRPQTFKSKFFKCNSNKPWGGKNKIVKYIRTT